MMRIFFFLRPTSAECQLIFCPPFFIPCQWLSYYLHHVAAILALAATHASAGNLYSQLLVYVLCVPFSVQCKQGRLRQ